MALSTIRQAEHPLGLSLVDRRRHISLEGLLEWSLRGAHFVAVAEGSWPISATSVPPAGFSATTYTPDPQRSLAHCTMFNAPIRSSATARRRQCKARVLSVSCGSRRTQGIQQYRFAGPRLRFACLQLSLNGLRARFAFLRA